MNERTHLPVKARFRVAGWLARTSAWTRETATAIGLGLLLGLPAAAIGGAIHLGLTGMVASLGLSAADAPVLGVGLRAGVAIMTFAAVLLITPMVWRMTADPTRLRAVALVSSQAFVLAVGLLVPNPALAIVLTWLAATAVGLSWLTWSVRWRGEGVAPSPLAGVLRPEIHPGQIWFAVITGAVETKVRPVIVLGATDRGWAVAYFTSRSPRAHLADRYIEVPAGALRGIAKDNWLAINDNRDLTRGQFRTYTGLAPKWLYVEACERTGVSIDERALTVDETSAGMSTGPLEATAKRLFHAHADAPVSVQPLEWSTLRAALRLPVRLRRDQ